jgi:hypothetical protein
LTLGTQADDFFPTHCSNLRSYIESENPGLPLAINSMVGRCLIFQVKIDKKKNDIPRNHFVINRAFDPTKLFGVDDVSSSSTNLPLAQTTLALPMNATPPPEMNDMTQLR